MDHHTKTYKNWQVGIESHNDDKSMVFKYSSVDLINRLLLTCDVNHLLQQYLADHIDSVRQRRITLILLLIFAVKQGIANVLIFPQE
jgi:hypothetical protein